MARVVEKELKTGAKHSVKTKRVRDAETGKFIDMHTVDANSATFIADITYAFRKNVKKARSKK